MNELFFIDEKLLHNLFDGKYFGLKFEFLSHITFNTFFYYLQKSSSNASNIKIKWMKFLINQKCVFFKDKISSNPKKIIKIYCMINSFKFEFLLVWWKRTSKILKLNLKINECKIIILHNRLNINEVALNVRLICNLITKFLFLKKLYLRFGIYFNTISFEY